LAEIGGQFINFAEIGEMDALRWVNKPRFAGDILLPTWKQCRSTRGLQGGLPQMDDTSSWFGL